jgi:hypothetical protein
MAKKNRAPFVFVKALILKAALALLRSPKALANATEKPKGSIAFK